MLKLFNVTFNMDKERTSKTKWPKLRRINSSSKMRSETPDLLKDLKKASDNLELKSSSSVSDISDAFEEIHKGGLFCRYPKINKKLTKIDYDKLTLQKFTSKFRTTMCNLRQEMKIDDNMLNENIDDIVQILQRDYEDKPLPEDIRETTEKILRDEEYINSSPSLSFKNVNYETEKDGTETYDILSGMWRMLGTNCDKDKFAITHPDYNAYQMKTPHWLETEPIPWEIMDDSKSKCEKWLNEQCQ